MAVVRANPAFVLRVWEETVRYQLAPRRAEAFLSSHEVGQLSKLPLSWVTETAREALARNKEGHLLLTEWVDVAAERLDALLARTNQSENRSVAPPEAPPSGQSAEDAAGHQEWDPRAEALRWERLAAWEASPEFEAEEARRRAEVARASLSEPEMVPCHVCGRTKVHAYDCTRKGAGFVARPVQRLGAEAADRRELETHIPTSEVPVERGLKTSAGDADDDGPVATRWPTGQLEGGVQSEPGSVRRKLNRWFRRRRI